MKYQIITAPRQALKFLERMKGRNKNRIRVFA
jgi:hypothetical protein